MALIGIQDEGYSCWYLIRLEDNPIDRRNRLDARRNECDVTQSRQIYILMVSRCLSRKVEDRVEAVAVNGARRRQPHHIRFDLIRSQRP